MRVNFRLLSIILFFVLLSSVSAVREKQCTAKDLIGTDKPRFKKQLQSCAALGFFTTGCRKIQRRENCRKLEEDKRLMNKGLSYIRELKKN